MFKKLVLSCSLIVVSLIGISCASSAPTATTNIPLTAFESRYRILDAFPNYFWCDPDYYPIGSPGGELGNALTQFDSIRGNDQEFAAIITRISLDRKSDYTPEEKLLVYRQHKLLTRVLVDFQTVTSGFNFVIRVGEGQGERIEGNVSPEGTIKISKREPSFNTCPICLSKGTLIDSPTGPISVEELKVGTLVWTLDSNGQRVAATVIKTAMTPQPSYFDLLLITLGDGRSVTASPGHHTADEKFLGNLNVGDDLDGSIIKSIEIVGYEGRTYDILPAGVSGCYWANGILLASTIVK